MHKERKGKRKKQEKKKKEKNKNKGEKQEKRKKEISHRIDYIEILCLYYYRTLHVCTLSLRCSNIKKASGYEEWFNAEL